MPAKTKTDNNRPTPEEAREVLVQDQQANLQACRDEIDAVLDACRISRSNINLGREG